MIVPSLKQIAEGSFFSIQARLLQEDGTLANEEVNRPVTRD